MVQEEITGIFGQTFPRHDPWDCHVCRPIDPPGTTPGLIGIYGSPMGRVWVGQTFGSSEVHFDDSAPIGVTRTHGSRHRSRASGGKRAVRCGDAAWALHGHMWPRALFSYIHVRMFHPFNTPGLEQITPEINHPMAGRFLA